MPQHAIFELRLDLRGVGIFRECERTVEYSEARKIGFHNPFFGAQYLQ